VTYFVDLFHLTGVNYKWQEENRTNNTDRVSLLSIPNGGESGLFRLSVQGPLHQSRPDSSNGFTNCL